MSEELRNANNSRPIEIGHRDSTLDSPTASGSILPGNPGDLGGKPAGNVGPVLSGPGDNGSQHGDSGDSQRIDRLESDLAAVIESAVRRAFDAYATGTGASGNRPDAGAAFLAAASGGPKPGPAGSNAGDSGKSCASGSGPLDSNDNSGGSGVFVTLAGRPAGSRKPFFSRPGSSRVGVGFKVPQLIAFTHALQLRGVGYQMGAKFQELTADLSKTPPRLDCSGFAQEAFYLAANLRLPEGSWEIRDYLALSAQKANHLVERIHRGELYEKACQNRKAVLCCTIDPVQGVHSGHIWFVVDGWTCESYGGHGVGRRLWNTPVLVRECNWIFVLNAG